MLTFFILTLFEQIFSFSNLGILSYYVIDFIGNLACYLLQLHGFFCRISYDNQLFLPGRLSFFVRLAIQLEFSVDMPLSVWLMVT